MDYMWRARLGNSSTVTGSNGPGLELLGSSY